LTLRIQVPILKLDDSITLPSYAYEADAGLDLASNADMVIQPFQRCLVPTGFALSIPEGYAGFVLPRSGLSLRTGLSLINTPGLIDSHYRGEIKVAVVNLDANQPVAINRGDRIAQLVIMPVAQVELLAVDALESTSRGEGGFGSSGIASR